MAIFGQMSSAQGCIMRRMHGTQRGSGFGTVGGDTPSRATTCSWASPRPSRPRHSREAGGLVRPRTPFSRGFSLVELLVAMAIFTALMGGILVLFVGSMRAVSQGRQSINGYEMARGTLMVLEDDLTTGFTARDYADAYSLYGSPIGMVFVGTTRGSATGSVTAQKTGAPGLARITYVLYSYRGDTAEIPDPIASAVNYVSEVDGKTYYIDGQPYLLLRYVEPNASDLTKFPIDWNAAGEIVPPGQGVFEQRVQQEASSDYSYFQSTDYQENFFNERRKGQGVVIPIPMPSLESFVQAKRCELWLTMLAGGRDRQDAANAPLPSAWNGVNPGMLDKLSRDYVLCESVVGLAPRLPLAESNTDPRIGLWLPPDGRWSVFTRSVDPFAGTGTGFREIWFDPDPSNDRPGFVGTPLLTYRVANVNHGAAEIVSNWWNDPFKVFTLLRARWEQIRRGVESDPVAWANARQEFARAALVLLEIAPAHQRGLQDAHRYAGDLSRRRGLRPGFQRGCESPDRLCAPGAVAHDPMTIARATAVGHTNADRYTKRSRTDNRTGGRPRARLRTM